MAKKTNKPDVLEVVKQAAAAVIAEDTEPDRLVLIPFADKVIGKHLLFLHPDLMISDRAFDRLNQTMVERAADEHKQDLAEPSEKRFFQAINILKTASPIVGHMKLTFRKKVVVWDTEPDQSIGPRKGGGYRKADRASDAVLMEQTIKAIRPVYARAKALARAILADENRNFLALYDEVKGKVYSNRYDSERVINSLSSIVRPCVTPVYRSRSGGQVSPSIGLARAHDLILNGMGSCGNDQLQIIICIEKRLNTAIGMRNALADLYGLN